MWMLVFKTRMQGKRIKWGHWIVLNQEPPFNSSNLIIFLIFVGTYVEDNKSEVGGAVEGIMDSNFEDKVEDDGQANFDKSQGTRTN